MKEITLQEMLSTIIGELRENGRWGTAHIYQSTLNVFSAFNNYRDLHLRKLNPVVLKRFEMHLRQRDCSWNTVSTYMKVIRSAYNRAVDLRCVRYLKCILRQPLAFFSNSPFRQLYAAKVTRIYKSLNNITSYLLMYSAESSKAGLEI